MLRIAPIIFCWIACLLPLVSAATEYPHRPDKLETTQPAGSLSYTDAIALGLVEGITGTAGFFDWAFDSDQCRYQRRHSGDRPQRRAIIVKDGDGQLRPRTIGEAAYDFVIVIQAGAILAVIWLYWEGILHILYGILGIDPKGRRLALNLLVAFLRPR